MFIELHIIQSFPPSNLNRDDIGQPKDCDFGGVRRARISSQCQKRAIRWSPEFTKATGVPLGSRTQLMVRELTRRLENADIKEQAKEGATLFAEAYSGAMHAKRKDETAVLLYLSKHELDWVATRLKDNWNLTTELLTKLQNTEEKKKKKVIEESVIRDIVSQLVKETKERTSAPDIALFGRMLADRPETNIDAACQVAHAISTHAIGKMELDYYTAMDDEKDKHDPGASYLDVAYFTSACFYRYARVDWTQLNENLKDKELAVKTVEGFLRASEAAIPSGKQNSHAQQTRPSFMLAVLRNEKSAGWSLVNAFEKPVRPPKEAGLIEESVERLGKHFEHLCDFYGDNTIKTIAVALPDGSVKPDLLSKRLKNSVMNMNDWVAAISEPLRRRA